MWEISKLLINNPKRKKLGGERKERGMKKKEEGREGDKLNWKEERFGEKGSLQMIKRSQVYD